MVRNSATAERRRLGEGQTKSRKQSPGRHTLTVEPEYILTKLAGMGKDRIIVHHKTKYKSAALF